MSVKFNEVVFRNNTGLEVTLTIEAPSGTVVTRPQNVGANSTATVPLNIDNCASARIIASDSTHGEYKQFFGMAAPLSGRPSYLESIDVRYSVGSFNGNLKARTE